MKYHLITTQQGNTVLGCSSNGVTAVALVAGDAVKSSQDFKATHAEYVDLLGKTHTHDLKFDPKTKQVTAHAKPNKKALGQSETS